MIDFALLLAAAAIVALAATVMTRPPHMGPFVWSTKRRGRRAMGVFLIGLAVALLWLVIL